MDLPVQIGQTELVARFWLLPPQDQQHDLIGTSWLCDAKAVIVCHKAQISFGPLPADLVQMSTNQVEAASAFLVEIQRPEEYLDPTLLDTVICKERTQTEREATRKILNDYSTTWQHTEVGKCSIAKHNIVVENGEPIHCRARRLTPEESKIVKAHVEDLLASGAIRRSKSPWASPVVLVCDPVRRPRLCIDYRGLNSVTKHDAYPIPRIDSLLQRLSHATVFSTIDLKSGEA